MLQFINKLETQLSATVAQIIGVGSTTAETHHAVQN